MSAMCGPVIFYKLIQFYAYDYDLVNLSGIGWLNLRNPTNR